MNAEPDRQASDLPAPKKRFSFFGGREKKKRTARQEALSWVLMLLAAVLISLLIRMYVFEPIRVDGDSMLNTLRDGEIVWVSKPGYLRGDIHRGDVIICRYPQRSTESHLDVGGSFQITFTHHTLFVKRLIALPGDTLEMRSGAVYVNGELVDESGIDMQTPSDTTFGPVILGEDSYFVMGDNRGVSNDSRRVGPITRDMIVGHVKRVILPLSKFMQRVE